MSPASTQERFHSIDRLRGLVMVLMLLDHARALLYRKPGFSDPINLDIVNQAEFFLRWITHLCAPGFILLAGMAIWIKVSRTDSKETYAQSLFKRGLVLLLLEITIINFVWVFNFLPHQIYLQVIAAIGLSFMVISQCLHLSARNMLIIATLLLVSHTPLIQALAGTDYSNTLPYMLIGRMTIEADNALTIINLYPLIPWLGVMMLGYALAAYTLTKTPEIRRKTYTKLGCLSLLSFLIVRGFDGGDIVPSEGGALSFLNCSKYPPSACFLLMTLGILLLLLALFESSKAACVHWLTTFGKHPLFFYITHLYVLGVLALIIPLTGLGQSNANDAYIGITFYQIFIISMPVLGIYYVLLSRFKKRS